MMIGGQNNGACNSEVVVMEKASDVPRPTLAGKNTILKIYQRKTYMDRIIAWPGTGLSLWLDTMNHQYNLLLSQKKFESKAFPQCTKQEFYHGHV